MEVFATENGDIMRVAALESCRRRFAAALPLNSLGYFAKKTHSIDRLWSEREVCVSFVIEGEGKVELEGTILKIAAPCVLMELGGYRYRYGPSSWWREYYLAYSIDTPAFRRRWGMTDSSPHLWPMGNPDRVSACLEEMYSLAGRNDTPSFIDRIDQLADTAVMESLTGQEDMREPVRSGVYAIERYAREHCRESINWERLAERHGMSIASFHRHWKHAFTLTPARHVLRIRLSHAAHQITHSPRSFKSIAGDTGFADLAYFSNTFKQHYHLSPSEYRRRFRPCGRGD